MTKAKTFFFLILLVSHCHCFFWNPYGQTNRENFKLQIGHRLKGLRSRLHFSNGKLTLMDQENEMDKAIKGLETKQSLKQTMMKNNIYDKVKDVIQDQLYLSVRNLRKRLETKQSFEKTMMKNDIYDKVKDVMQDQLYLSVRNLRKRSTTRLL